MNILNLASGQDIGGQQGRTRDAFRRHAPDWPYVAVTKNPTFYKIETRWNTRAIRDTYWPAADVVHAHNNFLGLPRFERWGGVKPYVLHLHGTAYRSDPEPILAEAQRRGVVVLASTLDLWALAPDQTEWLPAPYSMDLLESYRDPELSDTLRIAHAPTNRHVKSTVVLVEAVDRLRSEGHAVELDIIEGQPWETCLRRKGQADLYVDQLLLGYGCNAVEAWGMGIPVIAGVDPERVAKTLRPQRIPTDTLDIMKRKWGTLPFYPATEETLYDAIKAMLDPALRSEYAARGKQHVRRWHSEEVVVEQLQRLYHQALGQNMENAA